MLDGRAVQRALVIDADPVARAETAAALRAAEFDVTEVGDAPSALAQLPRLRPALVIADALLPGRDGISLCDLIRHLPSGAQAALVITTTVDRPGLIARAFAAGASDVVRKPIDTQLFAYRARFLVRSKQAQRELQGALAELQQSRESLADAQRIGRIGSWQWAPETGELSWSEYAAQVIPLPVETEAQGFALYLECVHPLDAERVEKEFAAAASEGRALDSEHRVLHPQAGERSVHLRGELQWDVAGRGFLHGTIQDVTLRRESEQRIHRLANYDGLTALPNRALLTESLEQLLAHARDHLERVAVISVGLDRFRRLNDALGHELADELLRRTAQRIVSCVQSAEEIADAGEPVIARVGGDEFVVAVGAIPEIGQVERLAARLLRATGRAMTLGSDRAEVSASAGIAIFPADGHDARRLLQNANTALQQAKRTQRGTHRFYSAQLSSEVARTLEMERLLRRALETGSGLELEYQPQLATDGDSFTGAEALVRLRTPEGALVSPLEFISVAEETGLILPLGEWVLNAACRTALGWTFGGRPLRIAVNVSSHQLRQVDLIQVVERALAASGLPAQRLELEITESAFVDDLGAAAETLSALRRMGVRIALDDFGTGFSTLSNLMSLPIDALKIDRSFVRLIEAEDHARAVIAAVIGIAYRLGLTVVAEGVENDAQNRFLRNERCHVIQGYLVGHSLPPAQFEQLLAAKK